VNQGSLQELHICRRALGIAHLLFADDTLLFMHISDEQTKAIKHVMSTYEKCSDQLINPSNCSMMFGPLCTEERKETALRVLNMPCTTQEEKYLGLPTPEGRMNKDKFKSTKEHLVK
jgi:hypothetical protein